MLLFIFAGLSAIDGRAGAAQELKVSLAFALAIAALAQSLGHVSGAHLNLAVTLGLMFNCRISAVRGVCYILAQMVGAVTASVVVKSYKPGESLGVNQLNVEVGPGLVIEFLTTLQLVLCVIAVTDKRRRDVTGSAPLAIGLSISSAGCGIDPAHSLGPAVIQGQMKDHWVYWLAPMYGGMAASLIYDFLLFPQARNLRSCNSILLSGAEPLAKTVND